MFSSDKRLKNKRNTCKIKESQIINNSLFKVYIQTLVLSTLKAYCKKIYKILAVLLPF